ncbi:MAG TPA: hypothetical protein VGM63_15765 [Mucilaginibacter sp.]
MTFEQAEKMLSEYEYLLGNKYKQFTISRIIIVPALLSYQHLLVLATQERDKQYHSLDKQGNDYELFVLFDLEDWSQDKPLNYFTLDALLHHMKK